MAAILAWIAESALGQMVLKWGLDSLIQWIKAWQKERADKAAIKKDADDSVKKLKDAKTGAEIDAAADDTLNHT